MTGHLERVESDHSADRKIVDHEVGEPVIQELRSDANQLARQMHQLDATIAALGEHGEALRPLSEALKETCTTMLIQHATELHQLASERAIRDPIHFGTNLKGSAGISLDYSQISIKMATADWDPARATLNPDQFLATKLPKSVRDEIRATATSETPPKIVIHLDTSIDTSGFGEPVSGYEYPKQTSDSPVDFPCRVFKQPGEPPTFHFKMVPDRFPTLMSRATVSDILHMMGHLKIPEESISTVGSLDNSAHFGAEAARIPAGTQSVSIGIPVDLSRACENAVRTREFNRIEGQICQELDQLVTGAILTARQTDIDAVLAPLLRNPMVAQGISAVLDAPPQYKMVTLYPLLMDPRFGGPAEKNLMLYAFNTMNISALDPVTLRGANPDVVIGQIGATLPHLYESAATIIDTNRSQLAARTSAAFSAARGTQPLELTVDGQKHVVFHVAGVHGDNAFHLAEAVRGRFPGMPINFFGTAGSLSDAHPVGSFVSPTDSPTPGIPSIAADRHTTVATWLEEDGRWTGASMAAGLVTVDMEHRSLMESSGPTKTAYVVSDMVTRHEESLQAGGRPPYRETGEYAGALQQVASAFFGI